MLYAGAALAGGVALYVLSKKATGESFAGSLGRNAASAVGDAAAGAIKGLGGVFGIPDTSMTQCQADLAAGRTWDASFSCPAVQFVGGIWSSGAGYEQKVEGARQIDRIIERQQRELAGLGNVYDQSTGEATGAYDEMGNRIY